MNVPPGYRRFEERGAIVVARDAIIDSVREALGAAPTDRPTLHGFASRAVGAQRYEGREAAWGITLPGTDRRVVVRHNRHGGAFRAVTGDLFLGMGRAPLELEVCIHLRGQGIDTPSVDGYAVYPAGLGFSRSDVMTEEVRDALDLGATLQRVGPKTVEREFVWTAVKGLLVRLAAASARHHDLNVKNILVTANRGDGPHALVLDVDRVTIEEDTTRADAGNRARLLRSIEKWRRLHGLQVHEDEMSILRRA